MQPSTPFDDLPSLASTLHWRPGKAGGEHQWTLSNDNPHTLDAWHTFRTNISLHGEDRPFYRTTFRYLDLPDGWTYWVMAKWIPHTRPLTEGDPATVAYVLNRKRTPQQEPT